MKPAIFVPYSMRMWMFTQVLVRTRTAPLTNLDRIRAAVQAVDLEQQVFGRTQDLDQWIQARTHIRSDGWWPRCSRVSRRWPRSACLA
ncbi:MAG TPA: hypothetical protein VE959_15925 [Bryobacteraceae bacterium]|nr:hypothetical protein [Bryobacteraceae bacterium]